MTKWSFKAAMAVAGSAFVFGGAAVAAGPESDPIDAILEGIDLDDDQQALADRLREDVETNRDQLIEAHEEMVDVFLTELERGDPDRGRLYGQVEEFVDLIGDASRDKLDSVLDLYEALDSRQQDTFRENIEEIRDEADMFGQECPPE